MLRMKVLLLLLLLLLFFILLNLLLLKLENYTWNTWSSDCDPSSNEAPCNLNHSRVSAVAPRNNMSAAYKLDS